jgi:hypothetical protein
VVLYICVRGIVEVSVPSQESEWSCISVLGVLLKCMLQARKVSGPVYLCSKKQDHSLSWLGTDTSTIPLTQIYRTTHFPGLEQTLENCIICLYSIYASHYPLVCFNVEVSVPSQESEWSCISVLGVLLKCLFQARKVSGPEHNRMGNLCTT